MFRSPLVSVLIFLSLSNATENASSIDESRDLLMKTLLTNYHPSSRPGRLNETLMVFANIELQHFDFRERDGAFHLVGLLHVRWRDPRLVWNPENHANMSHITISQRYIWVPDLEFYNNAPDKFLRMHRNGFVTVKNDGVIFWSDAIDINIFCTTYMKNWPHDKHECTLHLGSWTFDGFELDIIHVNPNASMSFHPTNNLKNMQYKVTEFNASHTEKYYSCCQYPYITMDYNITFERESSYAIIFRIPAISVVLFTLLGLSMEPIRTAPFWLNSISLWLICGQLIYFAYNSRSFTRDTPSIVTFFSASFVLVTLSQLFSVFSTYVTYSPYRGRLPYILDRMLNSNWALRLVPVSTTKRSENTTERFARHCDEDKLADDLNLIDRYMASNDWHRLMKLLQRLIFFLLAFVFLILCSTCFV